MVFTLKMWQKIVSVVLVVVLIMGQGGTVLSPWHNECAVKSH